MCGILGYYSANANGESSRGVFEHALNVQTRRGPDGSGHFEHEGLKLGHRRLSIIDLSAAAGQPMTDISGRFTIVFNGEIFNFPSLKKKLIGNQVDFKTDSDTEVLLNLFMVYREKCLDMLNGFFAFCIYDKVEKTVFIARDRYGVKPLYYSFGKNEFAFSSELRSLEILGMCKEIDFSSLFLYLQLNYVPDQHCIYSSVSKLQPGHYLSFQLQNGFQPNDDVAEKKWYLLESHATYASEAIPYEKCCDQLFRTMNSAVERRLISDVPLGAFLSGGVDSSIITALASRHTERLETFSLGFEDAPHFDETAHAAIVAKHCKTKHTEFKLGPGALMDAIPNMLDGMDEPFADSSALALYLLAGETRKKVTVALSGDGSDELFGGYQKHRASFYANTFSKAGSNAIIGLSALLSPFRGSRNSFTGNRIRQLHRLAEGLSMSERGRYWRWCCISGEGDVLSLLRPEIGAAVLYESHRRIEKMTDTVASSSDINHVLLNDCKLVLPGDMLVKVDRMSMAQSLEVRTPFLDKEVVELAFKIPSIHKIDKHHQKKILKDSFGCLLPEEIFKRRKQGFEVPLSQWFRGPMKNYLREVMDEKSILETGIFNPKEVKKTLAAADLNAQGDSMGKIWGLLVFQHWINNRKDRAECPKY